MSVKDSLNIVISGAESTRDRVGDLPSYSDDIVAAIETLELAQSGLKITIIGSKLIYACRIASGMLGPIDVANYVKDSEIIKEYISNQSPEDDYVTVFPMHVKDVTSDKIAYRFSDKESNAILQLRKPRDDENTPYPDFRSSTSPTVYILYGDPEKPMTCFEVMSHFDSFTPEKDFYLWRPFEKTASIKDISEDYIAYLQDPSGTKYRYKYLQPHTFNPFIGQKYDPELNMSRTFVESLKAVQEMCKVAEVFINYQVHKDKFIPVDIERISLEKTKFKNAKFLAIDDIKCPKKGSKPMTEDEKRYKLAEIEAQEFTIPQGLNPTPPELPPWAMNPETLGIKGCMYTYGLFPHVRDTSNIMEMTNNSGFRKQLLEIIIKVLVNMSIQNGFLTVENIKQYGGYFNVEMYQYISEAFRNMTTQVQ